MFSISARLSLISLPAVLLTVSRSDLFPEILEQHRLQSMSTAKNKKKEILLDCDDLEPEPEVPIPVREPYPMIGKRPI